MSYSNKEDDWANALSSRQEHHRRHAHVLVPGMILIKTTLAGRLSIETEVDQKSRDRSTFWSVGLCRITSDLQWW